MPVLDCFDSCCYARRKSESMQEPGQARSNRNQTANPNSAHMDRAAPFAVCSRCDPCGASFEFMRTINYDSSCMCAWIGSRPCSFGPIPSPILVGGVADTALVAKSLGSDLGDASVLMPAACNRLDESRRLSRCFLGAESELT